MRVIYPDRRLSGGRASPTRQAAVPEQSFRRTSGGFTAEPGLDTAAGHGHRVACSASSQQCPAGRHERGRERFEQLLERDAAVGLTGHERAVDSGEREARELVGDRAPRIVAERTRDLSAGGRLNSGQGVIAAHRWTRARRVRLAFRGSSPSLGGAGGWTAFATARRRSKASQTMSARVRISPLGGSGRRSISPAAGLL